MPLPPGVNSINDVSVTPKGRLIISTGFASATASECAGGMYYSDDEGVSWTLAFMWASSYASGFYKLILPDGFSSANKIMTTEDYDIKGLPIEALLKQYFVVTFTTAANYFKISSTPLSYNIVKHLKYMI